MGHELRAKARHGTAATVLTGHQTDFKPSVGRPLDGNQGKRVNLLRSACVVAVSFGALFAGAFFSREFKLAEGLGLVNSHARDLAMMRAKAEALNAKGTTKIDEYTNSLRMDVADSGVTFELQITAPREQIAPNFVELWRPTLLKNACADTAVTFTLSRGFSVTYSYVDSVGAPVGTVVIQPGQCPKP